MNDDAVAGSSVLRGSAGQPAPTTPSFVSIEPHSVTAPTSSRLPSASPQSNSPRAVEILEKRNLPASQPMTATSSSSSVALDHQANNSGDSNGPSPYGTRSRNRTGNARPNYAEDREPEIDFDWSSAKKRSRGVSGSGVAGSALSAEAERTSGSNTRRSSNSAGTPVVINGKATTVTGPRDHIPGMSSFSVNPEPASNVPASASSRKRKAPGNGLTTSHASSSTSRTSLSLSQRRQGAAGVPSATSMRATNIMTFENCQGCLRNGRLEADNGDVLSINDQVYLICEPPGEPYYLARIMEFLHVDNDQNQPVDSLRVNWYFRPRDIQRKTTDTRVVFASMQSDTSPITSLRGKCHILHKTDTPDLDEHKKTKDCFWYDKMFDRYIHRYYEVIPTSQVINVPGKVKKVLDERWRFVVVEIGRGKELTSAIKSCKRCRGYCASNDSVDCAVCKNTYHMNCVRPPLLKKPARGFGWSCGPCSRKQERRLEARNTTNAGDKGAEGEEEDFVEEEEEDHQGTSEVANSDQQHGPDSTVSGPRPPTAEQLAQAKLWPYRYLGIHCRVEDALDYDDRIYPRASSRLGPKHQAIVQAWHGRPVEFVKPPDTKRKYLKASGHKKDVKIAKDTASSLEADKMSRENRPKWVMDEPSGYVARGEDIPNSDLRNTAHLNFRMHRIEQLPQPGDTDVDGLNLAERESLVDSYIEEAKKFSFDVFGLRPFSTNFLDKALEVLVTNDYRSEQSLNQLKKMKRRTDLKEPEMGPADQRRFEEGVSRYGSELRNVSRHFGKSKTHGEIVRFYYMWKKSEAGKQIWGNFEGRKGKKQAKQNDSKLVDDVADDEDDSAFDNEKALMRKRGFECKFCLCRKSPQWRRAPGTAPGTTVSADANSKSAKDKGVQLLVALCQRCAGLWRKYGIPWENIDDVAKKVTQAGGRAWKRKMDEEMLSELASANEASSIGVSSTVAAAAASVGIEVSSTAQLQTGSDGPKKKVKSGAEVVPASGSGFIATNEVPRKRVMEKAPEPPLIPDQPVFKIAQCVVCEDPNPGQPPLLCCQKCRLSVHCACYGIPQGLSFEKWTCDPCTNDTTHQYSHNYDCVLCPVRQYKDVEIFEPVKTSHKKKSDREREKDRLERELIANALVHYRDEQEKKGRPLEPRQAVKRTSGNNWAHVICMIFHFWVKLAQPKTLEASEGYGAIPLRNYLQTCKLCKTNHGACIDCPTCKAFFHVACAQQYGYSFGLNIAPIKSAQKNTMRYMEVGGEVGIATAAVYCKEHPPKHLFHPLYSPTKDPPSNALQVFAMTHKCINNGGTGAGRKAAQIQAAAVRNTVQNGEDEAAPTASKRQKISDGDTFTASTASRSSRASPAPDLMHEEEHGYVTHQPTGSKSSLIVTKKHCSSCDTNVSPKWHSDRLLHYAWAKYPKQKFIGVGLPKGRALDISMQAAGHSESGGVSSHSHINNEHREASDTVMDQIESKENFEPSNLIDSESTGFNSKSLSQIDGNLEIDGNEVVNRENAIASQEPKHSSTTASNGPTNEMEQILPETNTEPLQFLCHKCFVQKQKNPPSPCKINSHDEAVQSDIQDLKPPSPPVSLVWPQTSGPQAQETHRTWPSPAENLCNGSERASDAIVHSPTLALSPPAQHYTAPSQQHFEASPRTYPSHGVNGHDRSSSYRPNPGIHYMPAAVNGHPPPSEPPSFVYRRNPDTGLSMTVPWVSPGLRVTHQPQARPNPSLVRSPPIHHHTQSPSVHMRSPPMQEQGPHGPPEADSNPFAVPTGPSHHASPQPQYANNNIYGSRRDSRDSRDRPRTPTSSLNERSDGRWPSEIVNGASASPSVRNLLR